MLMDIGIYIQTYVIIYMVVLADFICILCGSPRWSASGWWNRSAPFIFIVIVVGGAGVGVICPHLQTQGLALPIRTSYQVHIATAEVAMNETSGMHVQRPPKIPVGKAYWIQ